VRPGADPDALLLTAAKSLDPEALYIIGKVTALKRQMAHSNDATEEYAWMLVGCQRGFPCNGNFDWITTGCPNCTSAGDKQAVPLDYKAAPESEDFDTIGSFLIFERDDERVCALINPSHLEAKVRVLS